MHDVVSRGWLLMRLGLRPIDLFLLACLVLVSLLASCLAGAAHVPSEQALLALADGFGLADASSVPAATRAIVWDLRFSRAVLALAVGGALAMSGAVFQTVLRNPLADPFTLGVSAGAALGAALAIFFGLASSGGAVQLGLGALPPAALLGALGALAMALLLGRGDGGAEDPRRDRLVLAGVALSSILAALIALVKALDEEAAGAVMFWILGSLQGRGWGHLVIFLPFFLLGTGVMIRHARDMDVLALGAEQARLLGVEAGAVRWRLLVAASVAAAAAVSVSGIIGFVGLVAPHVVRLSLRPRGGGLLLAAGLAGGLLLLWSDLAARTLLAGQGGGAELPVGVVTALAGGPVFCILLGRRTGQGEGAA